MYTEKIPFFSKKFAHFASVSLSLGQLKGHPQVAKRCIVSEDDKI